MKDSLSPNYRLALGYAIPPTDTISSTLINEIEKLSPLPDHISKALLLQLKVLSTTVHVFSASSASPSLISLESLVLIIQEPYRNCQMN
jgi:hypothetical protein